MAIPATAPRLEPRLAYNASIVHAIRFFAIRPNASLNAATAAGGAT
jgi:hypothetical protein